MIEPAALGKPVLIGPYTNNFSEPVQCFRAAGAMTVVSDARSLEREMRALLGRAVETVDTAKLPVLAPYAKRDKGIKP